jgi:hypothetical protein
MLTSSLTLLPATELVPSDDRIWREAELGGDEEQTENGEEPH